MALDQLRAFRAGRPQESLGPVERVGVDGFPLLASSELRGEHEKISGVLVQLSRYGQYSTEPVPPADARAEIQKWFGQLPPPGELAGLVLALLERQFAFDAKLSEPPQELSPGYSLSYAYDYGGGAWLMGLLMDAGAEMENVAGPVVEWFNSYRFVYYGTGPVSRVIEWAARRYSGGAEMPSDLREKFLTLRGQCVDLGGYNYYGKALLKRLDQMLGAGPWQVLVPVEAWAVRATEEVMGAGVTKDPWLKLLEHCAGATAARPSGKWLKTGKTLVEGVGRNAYRAAVLRWFPLVDAARTIPTLGMGWENVDERQRMHEVNATVLRGLLWLCPELADAEVCRAISKVAMSAYRKIRGLGPRAVKVGNAAVYALSAIGTAEAVGQLAMLKVRVKFGTAQKEIEKAFDAAASALGLPRDQIEEMGVPSYGLEEVGVRRETLAGGEFVAEVRVNGREAALHWTRAADGKALKSVPAKVKSAHKEELKELQGAVKDIAGMLPAQSERLDSMFLLQKTWGVGAWRERYLDHPLVGTLARRLVWVVDGVPVIAPEGVLEDVEGRPVEVGRTAEVALWHPVGRGVEEVQAWRRRLEALGVTQPFKQAHREVYLLTDAERNTRTYSNRFAAHVIRQHQFHALAAARGWRNKLRLMVDDTYPPASKALPAFGLRAEFWVEGVGEDFGTDTTDSGAFLRLSTDQVRFYRLEAAENSAHAGGGGYENRAAGPGTGDVNEPLPLEQVPALAFSEVMRDVDLFVGVASVGNDPTWRDGGPGGRYRTYWESYSFGELSATAATRKEILERLVPRLKIRERCSFSERFLVVRGELRTYKIHLGSGNILMEPNDQYLCIVPDRSMKAGGDGEALFLPFEGDSTLSLILSKAFLLAEDRKIKDPSIVSQIGRG